MLRKQNNRYGNLDESYQMNPMITSHNHNHNHNHNESRGPAIDINISYENYFPDDKIAEQKKQYGNELLEQIRLNNERKRLEKAKRLQEELDEERRLAKERERLALLKKANESMQYKQKTTLIKDELAELNAMKARKAIEIEEARKISISNIDINPFKELIEEKVRDREDYHNDKIDEMRRMYNDYSNKVMAIDEELRNIKMMIIHANLYKVDMVQELIDLRKALLAKKYQEDFKRDHIFKEYKMSQQRKREINEFYARNQYRLPIINLSHHILSPGIRLNNEWFYNEKTYEKEPQPDKDACYQLINKTSKQMQRLNRYDDKIFY